jgi:hypothetical protein
MNNVKQSIDLKEMKLVWHEAWLNLSKLLNASFCSQQPGASAQREERPFMGSQQTLLLGANVFFPHHVGLRWSHISKHCLLSFPSLRGFHAMRGC